MKEEVFSILAAYGGDYHANARNDVIREVTTYPSLRGFEKAVAISRVSADGKEVEITTSRLLSLLVMT